MGSLTIMRVLLIKTSSMGDILHTLPALTDAQKAIPDIVFDWVIEDTFVDIPRWHPAVGEIIPVALRRWRKGLFSKETQTALLQLRQRLREREYDLILDAQSLVKSALITFLAKGPRAGLDWKSARESLASLAYQRKYKVNFYQHAIVRMRELFSQALGYPLPNTVPEGGLTKQQFQQGVAEKDYLVFLHGTTWDTKLWPEVYWVQLANMAAEAGYRVKMGGGNDEEVARAKRIASQCAGVDALPHQGIAAMAKLLSNSKGAVAVDTGFGHLAAALDLPTVSLYGPTNPEYTGALGKHSVHLAPEFACAPCLSRECTYKGASDVTPACFAKIPPALVWNAVKQVISQA
jgi:heptosyltransferase-1